MDTTPTVTATAAPGDDVIDIRLLSSVVRRRWKVVVATLVAFIAAGVLYALMRDHAWEAQTKLVAHSSSSQGSSQLAGLATQFGVRLPSDAGVATSPELYIEMVGSMDLLRKAADTAYSVRQDDGTVTHASLPDIFGVESDDPELRLREAAGILQRQTTVRFDRLSGIIVLGVEVPSRDLAVQLTHRLVELLNESMLDLRQKRVEDEADFVQSRMAVALDALISADDTLASFMARNRVMSMDQQIRAARLQQNADLHRQVYLSLAQSFEQAKIDQIRDMPLVSMIEHPEHTVRRVGPSGKVILVLSFILGLFAGIMLAITTEGIARLRAPA